MPVRRAKRKRTRTGASSIPLMINLLPTAEYLTTVNGDNRPISRLSWNTISRVIRILIISSITLIQETAHSGNLTYIRRRKKTRNTCIREAMTSICATLPSIASLKTPVKATKVKFEVHSGKNGYVSCDEMQFFKRTRKTLSKNSC